ncbi:MFS transporter [Leucothrix mucor]|uniref:MFS transporter n=1 Tax=Leucothrix mucor TaxID=45248 RepID=UPI0003B68686|nr:MFS transporter [Leucothrix mucor]
MNRTTPQQVPRKGIWSWMLFDWASQPFHTLILTFVFAPYFTSQVASSDVVGQTYWGYAVGIAGLIIALLSPVLGALADATGPRKPWIFGFSLLGVLGSLGLWWILPNASDSMLIWGLVAFGIALIGFEFAAVFNNAMMPDLVPREELGKLSGSSWALGYVGGLFCLVLILGFMVADPESGKTLLGGSPLFGLDPATHEGDRASGPLTAIWLALFIIPLFLFTPDQPKRAQALGAVKRSLESLWSTIRNLPKNQSLLNFLMSSMLYRDALNGLYAFGGIYAAGVLQWSIVQIGIFGILANVTGAIGAWIGGRMDARFGPKPVVRACILLLILASVLVVSTDPEHVLWIALPSGSNLPDLLFYACGALIGAAGGALQAASRTLMVDQAEPEKMTEAFGLYALSGRATSFIAPIAIAATTTLFASQRIGVTPVIVLFIISLVLLPKVRSRIG